MRQAGGGLAVPRHADRRAHLGGDRLGDVVRCALDSISMMRFSSAMRSALLVCENVGNAARAAATARSTSAAEPMEILVIGLLGRRIDDVEGRAASPGRPRRR